MIRDIIFSGVLSNEFNFTPFRFIFPLLSLFNGGDGYVVSFRWCFGGRESINIQCVLSSSNVSGELRVK